MRVIEISRKYNKSDCWLYTKSGRYRIQQIKDLFGEATEETFAKYHEFQHELLRVLEDGFNDGMIMKKELALFVNPKCKYPNETGFNFYNRIVNKVYDDDKFLDPRTIDKLLKIKEIIFKRREEVKQYKNLDKIKK